MGLFNIFNIVSKDLYKNVKEAKEEIPKILNEYGLAFSDMTLFVCKYAGGHPDRDTFSSSILSTGM